MLSCHRVASGQGKARLKSWKSHHRALLCVLSHFSRVWPFATPWTVARQAPLSMGFSRQEFRSGLPCPPPGDLRDPGIEPTAPTGPALQAGSLPLSLLGSPLCSAASSNTQGVCWKQATGAKRCNSEVRWDWAGSWLLPDGHGPATFG